MERPVSGAGGRRSGGGPIVPVGFEGGEVPLWRRGEVIFFVIVNEGDGGGGGLAALGGAFDLRRVGVGWTSRSGGETRRGTGRWWSLSARCWGTTRGGFAGCLLEALDAEIVQESLVTRYVALALGLVGAHDGCLKKWVTHSRSGQRRYM